LKLLLDEHLWPGLPALVRKFAPGSVVESIHDYRSGALMNCADEHVLAEARRGGFALVTFDLNTIPALLREKATVEEDHEGVIFVSSKSFAQNDHGGLARALAGILLANEGAMWTNRVVYLTRGKDD